MAIQQIANTDIQLGQSFPISVVNSGASSLLLQTANTTAITVDSSQTVNFPVTGQLITGDFSNATITNRVMFRSNTTNGQTRVGIFPNGSSTTAILDTFNSSDRANSSIFSLTVTSTDARLSSGISGTGTGLPITFYTTLSGSTTEKMRIDTSGNLGLGVTPSAWSFGGNLQFSNNSYITSSGTGLYLTTNVYNNGGEKYNTTNVATKYFQTAGAHQWFTAPSGTAGNAITFNQAMTLDASGNLGIGTTSPNIQTWRTGTVLTVSGDVAGQLQLNSSRTDATNVALGSTQFTYSTNSASHKTVAVIEAVTEGTTANQRGGAITFQTKADASTTVSERMRIDSSGNVNIGTFTTSITKKFTVVGEGNFSDASNNFRLYMGFGTIPTSGGSGAYIYNNDNSPLVFGTTNTERMRIDASGYVGIGTTSTLGNSYLNVTLGIVARTAAASGVNPYLQLYNGNATTDLKIWRFGATSAGALSVETVNDAYTSSNTRFVIDSSGNVGIGTASPSQKLSVSGVVGASGSGGGNASNPSATHTSSSSVRVGLRGNLMVSDNAALYGVGTYLANNLFFKNATGYPGYIESAPGCYIGLVDDVIRFHRIGTGTANADITSLPESMRIDSSGNLFVGCTSSPSASVFGVQLSPVLTTAFHKSSVNSTGDIRHWGFYNTNGLVGGISTNGSATSYNTSSDYRLKENITPMVGALAKVALLKPVTYKWKADGSDGEGFIAHELAVVKPDCVSGDKDAVDADGNPQYQGIDTSFLVATLTAAIQELTARVIALEANNV